MQPAGRQYRPVCAYLAALTVALWVLSVIREDAIAWTGADGRTCVYVAGGTAGFWSHSRADGTDQPIVFDRSGTVLWYRMPHTLGGFRLILPQGWRAMMPLSITIDVAGPFRPPTLVHCFHVGLPLWFPAVLLLLCSIRWVKRIGPGVCPSCGYDLRATPRRCPECGTVNEPAGATTGSSGLPPPGTATPRTPAAASVPPRST